MLPNLRNHSGVMLALCIAAFLFAGLVWGCDEYNKTQSLIHPGTKVSEAQLQGEVAQEQAIISKKQTAIATTQKAAASEYQQALAAVQQKYAAEMQAASDATDNLNTDATQFNQQLAAAQTDIQNKQAAINNVVTVLSGVVGTVAKGSFDPLSLLTTIPTLGITALGIGAMADKKQLQGVVTAQRTATPQTVAPVPNSGAVPAAGPTPYVVPAAGTAPPLQLAA